MSCFAIRRTGVTQPAGLRAHALSRSAAPRGFGPADLRSAYRLTAVGRRSRTIAVIDAFDDPTAEADLAVYRNQFGLPPCTTGNGCFRKVNQNGTAKPLPRADAGWSGETSLDLDMVSAICPGCSILLVEANNQSNPSLFAAVDRAVAMGAKFVSNSYGDFEFPGQTGPHGDAHFNHPGVAITASTGDFGYSPAYPATSRYVTAVGGTSLRRIAGGRGWAETAWALAGAGCSAFEPKPRFQVGVVTKCAHRAEADVSAVADPDTGVAVYQGFGGTGWSVFGGTSAAAPIVAAIYALAGDPGVADRPNTYPYAHPRSLFPVTAGFDGACGWPLCRAGSGWDGPSGLGTPNGTAAFTAPRPN